LPHDFAHHHFAEQSGQEFRKLVMAQPSLTRRVTIVGGQRSIETRRVREG
jgi:hypothetical protein